MEFTNLVAYTQYAEDQPKEPRKL